MALVFKTNPRSWRLAPCGSHYVYESLGAGLIFSLLAEDKPVKKRSSFHLFDYIFLTAVLTQNSNSFDSGSPANYDQSSSSDSDI